MFRFLTNKTTVLLLLLMLLVLMSSFSNDFVINDKPNEFENEDISDITTPDHDDIENDESNDENEDDHDSLINRPGLKETVIELIAPAILPVGEPLEINIALTGYEVGIGCLLSWYVNGEIAKEDRIITGSEIPGFTHTVEYSRIMDESVDIKVSLKHTTLLNELHEIETEKTIIIENYDISHWKKIETPRVLNMVQSLYNGNFTLEWALENDFDAFDKELYVNAKGYTSRTEYLLWINRDFQRVNVFVGTGAANEWELLEVFIISTGGWVNSTPRGVTTIPSRNAAGWIFIEQDYRVEPVVRFWPEQSSPEGSSYAFHSRPLDIQTKEVKDERIGFPASSGCIRMYCEDAWWIYDNIPDHTTVVVY